jgi:hypothetical protein
MITLNEGKKKTNPHSPVWVYDNDPNSSAG